MSEHDRINRIHIIFQHETYEMFIIRKLIDLNMSYITLEIS